MFSKLTASALLLGALGVASADSCTFGAYSCQGNSPSRCVYTSGVATANGYTTGWVALDTCASGCAMVGTIASCKAAGSSGGSPTTLVTQVAPPTTTQASTSTATGGVFQQKSSSAPPAPSSTASAPGTSSNNVLLTSVAGQTVDATMYYDINGAGTCGAAQGITNFGIEGGYTLCEPSDVSQAKTLKQRGTNNIVAMSNTILGANKAKYCGKKVVVTWEGKVRDDLDLFIWDGCEACNANDGLDFSSTIFGTITNDCAAGRIPDKMSWEIVDDTVLPYVA